jgi:subtilase family serine protease
MTTVRYSNLPKQLVMKSRLKVVLIILLIATALSAPVKAKNVIPLTPYDIRTAYDVNPLLQSGYSEKRVRVAIVNTGIDGTFGSDLKAIGNIYGLPNPVISVVRPFGSDGTNHESPQSETTADAEFVHAMAPDAKLLMVLTGTHTYLDGFSYVIDHNAADIATLSPSWAYWGQEAGDLVQLYNDGYAKSVGEKISLIAASNDWGVEQYGALGYCQWGFLGDISSRFVFNASVQPVCDCCGRYRSHSSSRVIRW